MIRKNIKLLIGLMIGIMVSGLGVYAANSLNASSVTIDKSNMSKVETNTLQSALNYLYSQSEKNNMITIESGVKHLSQTYLGIAYLDPTNLNNKCTAANSVSTTGTKTGCMKWYIYKEYYNDEDGKWYYKMILDHNTIERQAWNTTGIYGTNVEFKANNGNLAYDELMKLESVSGWKITPDLIEAEEVAGIVGYSGFNSGTSDGVYLDSKNQNRTNTSQGTSNYAWLFDNLGLIDWGCIEYGCNVNNVTEDNDSGGYWTKTTYGTAGENSHVWIVVGSGRLSHDYSENNYYGIRPVITIPKDRFSN